MSRSKVGFGLPLALTLACTAFAQTPATTTTGSEDREKLAEAIKIFDTMAAQSERLHASTLPRPKSPQGDAKFLRAIPQFRKATADFRYALGAQADLKKPIQNVNKLIDPFTDYFKSMKLKPPAVDAAEFREYTQKELEWETLTTAERVDNNLQRAGLVVKDSNATGSVSLKAIEFFRDIHGDLDRLKWLTSRVAAPRPSTRTR